MNNMIQVVIEIPEEKYIRIDDEPCTELALVVRNGTVLPEQHGRLIDADALNKQVIPAIKKDGVIYVKLLALQDLIDDALTILEAKDGDE